MNGTPRAGAALARGIELAVAAMGSTVLTAQVRVMTRRSDLAAENDLADVLELRGESREGLQERVGR